MKIPPFALEYSVKSLFFLTRDEALRLIQAVRETYHKRKGAHKNSWFEARDRAILLLLWEQECGFQS